MSAACCGVRFLKLELAFNRSGNRGCVIASIKASDEHRSTPMRSEEMMKYLLNPDADPTGTSVTPEAISRGLNTGFDVKLTLLSKPSLYTGDMF